MKKFILPITAATFLLFTACQGKKISRQEMMNDVNDMCKCYRAGKESSTVFMECSNKNEKVRDKYRADNSALTQYDADLKKCMDGGK